MDRNHFKKISKYSAFNISICYNSSFFCLQTIKVTFFILHHFPVLFLPLCLPLCLQGRCLKCEQLLTPVVSMGFRQRARARLRRQEHQDRSKKRIQIVTCPIIEQTFCHWFVCPDKSLLGWFWVWARKRTWARLARDSSAGPSLDPWVFLHPWMQSKIFIGRKGAVKKLTICRPAKNCFLRLGRM